MTFFDISDYFYVSDVNKMMVVVVVVVMMMMMIDGVI